jgi:predicted GNAT family N-acyltransferase
MTPVEVETRRYRDADFAGCISIMMSNMPACFLATDVTQLESWLTTPHKQFFVCVVAGVVVACGGYSQEPDTQAMWLRWGMVDAAHHGLMIGTHLLRYRLAHLARSVRDVPPSVSVATSQHSQGFFGKHGFVVCSWQPNWFGPGHDRVEMTRELTGTSL